MQAFLAYHIRLFSLGFSVFLSLFLSGCIYSGTTETGYYETVVDKSELTKEPGEEGLSLDLSKYYATHRESITSSDTTGTVKVNYVHSGDESKPAIVFVHGTPGNWQAFLEYLLIANLKQNAHLVSIDRPGWGDSSCETAAGKDCFYPLLKQQSEYLDTLIEKLDQQNNHQGIILVGHSLGGPLIGQMALDYPEQVKGLVFIASPFDPGLSGPRWYNRLSKGLAWFVPKELRRSNKEMMPLAKQLKQMKASWASIDAPIWVIQGSKDDLVDRKNLDFAKTIFADKDAQFIEVEESGHFVVWEKKSVIVESINQALENLQPSG